MQWPGQTTPATPMQWPGARPTTTAPLGGVPETIAPTSPESSPWGNDADSGGGGGLLWGVLGVGALVAVVAWQMRSRQQERGRAATRLRGEELRQDMTESRVKRLEEGPDWVRLWVAPGASISDKVLAGYAGGWAVLPTQVEIVSAGMPDEYLVRVKPQVDE